MIVLFIRARLEHVAELSLPKGYTYTITVRTGPLKPRLKLYELILL